jgi:cytochrome b561
MVGAAIVIALAGHQSGEKRPIMKVPSSLQYDRPVDRERYSQLARINHWLTAALLAVLVPSGLYAHYLGKGDFREWMLDDFHKPLGLTVIILTLYRLGTSTRRDARPSNYGFARWERGAAVLGHVSLYGMLLLVPLSGLIMSQGAGKPIVFFGLFTLPQLLPIQPGVPIPEQYWFKLGKWLHTDILEWTLYAVFALHMAGVIKHQFIDGDGNFIQRMWGFHKS